jgi:hypothetical protein
VNFDEPVRSDPLFWAGIVVGLAGGVLSVLSKDLHGFDAVGMVVLSVVGTTWFWAGLIATTIRGLYRRWRDRRADIKLLLKEGAVLKETE